MTFSMERENTYPIPGGSFDFEGEVQTSQPTQNRSSERPISTTPRELFPVTVASSCTHTLVHAPALNMRSSREESEVRIALI
jgi:hypothetical protein